MWDNFLDWIARAYFWFYCKFWQRPPDEPWTRQTARFEQRWPFIFWLLQVAILLIVDRLNGWWWLLIIPFNLAAIWWFAHILRYRVAHPDNHPFKGNVLDRAATWAAKRINYNKILKN